MKISEIKKAIKVALEAEIAPLLVGQAGIGKTQAVYQFAAENDMDVIPFRIGQMADAGEIVGLADFKRDELGQAIATKFLMPEFLNRKDNSRPFILFLDEVNRGTKDILQAVFQLVLERRIAINGFEIPKGSGVVAAMNPSTDDFDVLDFDDDAFNDRFIHIKVTPDVKEWAKYAKKAKISHSLTSFVTENSQDFLHASDFDLKVKPSFRSVEKLDQVIKVAESHKLKASTINELIFGMFGIEVGSKLVKHLKENVFTLKPEELLGNFKKYEKQLKAFAKQEENSNRNDILNELTSGVFDYINENSNILDKNPELLTNLIEFIKIVPIDIKFSFFKKVKNSLKESDLTKTSWILDSRFNEVATEMSKIGKDIQKVVNE